MSVRRRRVGILVFDDVEVLDFCGPFEVFSLVRLDEARRREEPSPFEVLLVAGERRTVTANGGLAVIPRHALEECPALDILVVPGGPGVRRELEHPRLLDWIRRRAGEVEILASVCTGSMLLGFAGLLEGRHATTHWASLDWMREALPGVVVEQHQHVVRDGAIFTSAGISAGIDMALKVVEALLGEDIARATARRMEYPYPDRNERRIEIEGVPPAPTGCPGRPLPSSSHRDGTGCNDPGPHVCDAMARKV